TAGCATKADSTSIVEMLWPDTSITSSTRPSSQKYPASSFLAPSPGEERPGNRAQYVSINRGSAPPMVGASDGQGRVMARTPPPPGFTGLPSSSPTSAAIPGRGMVADPGLVVVTPGSGEIMLAPVSVCHHVSTIGQFLRPMFSWYQIQASGLMGSPTVPSSRSDDRSCLAGCSSPHFMNARMAVGAV